MYVRVNVFLMCLHEANAAVFRCTQSQKKYTRAKCWCLGIPLRVSDAEVESQTTSYVNARTRTHTERGRKEKGVGAGRERQKERKQEREREIGGSTTY